MVKYNVDRQKEIGMGRKLWCLRVGNQANAQVRKQVNDSCVTIPIDGVSATGLSDYIYRGLFGILPMDEIIERYGLDELEIKEAIDELFVRIGAIAD